MSKELSDKELKKLIETITKKVSDEEDNVVYEYCRAYRKIVRRTPLELCLCDNDKCESCRKYDE